MIASNGLSPIRTAAAVYLIRSLTQAATFRAGAMWTGFQRSATKQIVPTVDRA